MTETYDRSAEDTGNIVALEHVNLRIPDQRLATLFYITGLGLTRDPYLVTGVTNMWVNVGRNQFHLPTGQAQAFRGRIGLVLPDLHAAVRRLEAVRGDLAGTAFDFTKDDETLEVVCPWGNRLRCHAPDRRFGTVALGMPYLELDVAPGTAHGIGRFYAEILDAPVTMEGAAVSVGVGSRQTLVFRESDARPAEYDGHHIQIYVADFSGPHTRLNERGLVTEESDQHQYRFETIVDPESGAPLFSLEHEVRSMTHPLYARPLVNRNPAITNASYVPGYEPRPWSLPPDA